MNSSEWLQLNGFSARRIYLGERKETKSGEKWLHNRWLVVVSRSTNGAQSSGEFSSGVGNLKDGQPEPPSLSDYLYALEVDSSMTDESFEDWCTVFDRDTDSLKVRELYEECKRSNERLDALMSRKERKEFLALLEEEGY